MLSISLAVLFDAVPPFPLKLAFATLTTAWLVAAAWFTSVAILFAFTSNSKQAVDAKTRATTSPATACTRTPNQHCEPLQKPEGPVDARFCHFSPLRGVKRVRLPKNPRLELHLSLLRKRSVSDPRTEILKFAIYRHAENSGRNFLLYRVRRGVRKIAMRLGKEPWLLLVLICGPPLAAMMM